MPESYAANKGRSRFGLGGSSPIFERIRRSNLAGIEVLTATAADGTKKSFTATLRLDTPNEVDYYRHGGILQFVLRQMTA
ncbi:MAG: hypothetical protein IPN83_06895 [Holophagales bacterium]|jgi:aconitate hydratase|nr:hypothetical protein [Holophagales bacterium]